MTDNSFDKDNPLKQVLQLCSTLAGKGCDFSISVRIKDCFSFSLKSGKPQPQQAKKRSPSFYRRQERRRLLRKKNTDPSMEQFRETLQAKEKDTDSLDLNPHPDMDLFGLKENSEKNHLVLEVRQEEMPVVDIKRQRLKIQMTWTQMATGKWWLQEDDAKVIVLCHLFPW